MPNFDADYQNSTVFIYGSKSGALQDDGFLAVGFFVRVPSQKVLGSGYTYLVTNEHVVRGTGRIYARMHVRKNPGHPSVLPIPRGDGFEVQEFKESHFTISKQWDIAVVPYHVPENVLHAYMPTEHLISDYRENNDRFAIPIRPGDDVFMVSRVVRDKIRYEKENIAILRFGNVALCPRHEEKLFLVEMRSISGHSGSPVFVYESPFAWGSQMPRKMGIRLLGINRGHLRDFEQIITFDPSGKAIPSKRWFAETNMAISHVSPAWEVINLLNAPRLKEQRRKSDEKTLNRGDITPD